MTCIPEKGRGFVTVRAVTANLVSRDVRDFKEKSHETAQRDLLALRTYRAKRLGGRIPPPPSLFRVKYALMGVNWGGGGGTRPPQIFKGVDIISNVPPPPHYLGVVFYSLKWGPVFHVNSTALFGPSSFFCLSERLVKYDGYPNSVSGKLTQKF